MQSGSNIPPQGHPAILPECIIPRSSVSASTSPAWCDHCQEYTNHYKYQTWGHFDATQLLCSDYHITICDCGTQIAWWRHGNQLHSTTIMERFARLQLSRQFLDWFETGFDLMYRSGPAGCIYLRLALAELFRLNNLSGGDLLADLQRIPGIPILPRSIVENCCSGTKSTNHKELDFADDFPLVFPFAYAIVWLAEVLGEHLLTIL